MSQESVPDSDGIEEWSPEQLNYNKLEVLFRSKKEKDEHFSVSRTTSAQKIYPTLTIRLKNLSEEEEVLEQSKNRYQNRRRNVSFYQQHIYTIDAVAYALNISLEAATEVVKDNTVLIDKYHTGELQRYLRNQSKTSKKAIEKNEKQYKKKNNKKELASREKAESQNTFEDLDVISNTQEQEIQEKIRHDDSSDDDFKMNSDHENSLPANHEYNSDNSSDPSSNDDSETASEGEEEPVTVFRGRKYKSIEQLAKESKLPKSFFSLQNKGNRSVVRKTRKRQIQENRVGLARKKKTFSNTDTSLISDIFTTNDNYQSDDEVTPNNDLYDDNTDMEILYERSLPKQQKSIATLYEGEGLFRNDFQDDQICFYNVKSDIETRDLSDNDETDHTQDNDRSMEFALEDRSTGVDFLLSGPRGPYKKSNQTPAKPSMKRTMERTPRSILKTPRSMSVIKPRSSSNKSTSTPSKSALKIPGSVKARKFGRITPLKKQKMSTPINKSQAQITDKFPITPILDEVKRAEKHANKKMTPKKKPSQFYSIAPNQNHILPRKVNSSTTVVEGLSDKFTILKKSHLQFEQESEHLNTKTFQSSNKYFTGSNLYKVLFNNESHTINCDFKVRYGDRLISFSKMSISKSQPIKEYLDLLLKDDLLRLIKMDDLVKSINDVMGYCHELSVIEMNEVVGIFDNFFLGFQDYLRRKAVISNLEMYIMSICSLFYYISNVVYDRNFVQRRGVINKAHSIFLAFFKLESNTKKGGFRERYTDPIFSESITVLYSVSSTYFWSLLEKSNIKDLEFFELIYNKYEFKDTERWNIILNIMKHALIDKNVEDTKRYFDCLNRFVRIKNWKPSENVLCIMFEILKLNKFRNFPYEYPRPVIFNGESINNDSCINIYLNHLMIFESQTQGLQGKFLEKIMPISKVSNLDIDTFCNRLNLLLVLSKVFKKGFDTKIDEILRNSDLSSKLFIEHSFRALTTLVHLNEKLERVSKLSSLPHILNYVIRRNEYEPFKSFMTTLNSEKLNEKTERSLFILISEFKRNGEIINISSKFIKSFISKIIYQDDFSLMKEKYGDLDPVLFEDLWLFISATSVSHNLENWSRLISFNKFENEPYVYSYILRHSEKIIYEIEKNVFISTLIKNIVKQDYMPSFIGYIRTLEKIDPQLLESKGMIISSQKLQITINLLKSILRIEDNSTKISYLSLFISSLSQELNDNGGDIAYEFYSKKVVTFINDFGSDFVNSLVQFDNLIQKFELPSKIDIPITIEQNDKSLVINSYNLSINRKLEIFEELILNGIQKKKCVFCEVDELIKNFHAKKQINSVDQISDSEFYEICCLISIHIENLNTFSSCWIILNELTQILLFLFDLKLSFKDTDYFCLIRTIALFPILLNNRNTRFFETEYLCLSTIYLIILRLLKLCDGSIEYENIRDITSIFVGEDIFLNNIDVKIWPTFLIKSTRINELISKFDTKFNENRIELLTSQKGTLQMLKDSYYKFTDFLQLPSQPNTPEPFELGLFL